jgi:hypothetical protein
LFSFPDPFRRLSSRDSACRSLGALDIAVGVYACGALTVVVELGSAHTLSRLLDIPLADAVKNRLVHWLAKNRGESYDSTVAQDLLDRINNAFKTTRPN